MSPFAGTLPKSGGTRQGWIFQRNLRGYYALDGLPAFYGFLFAVFPLCVSRGYDNARFNVEMKRGLIVKANSDSETFGCGNNFHGINDLVFDFGEVLPLWVLRVGSYPVYQP